MSFIVCKCLKMPNYENGRIYKLVSDETDKVYVGSCTVRLSSRFSFHRTATKNKCMSKEIVMYDDVRCVLVENYPCKTKEELHAREYYWIKKLKEEGANVINKSMPTRSKKEYDRDNPDKKKACEKRYREKHKEQIAAVCKKWREDHAEELKEKKRLYHQQNKDKRKVKFTCECGSECRINEKARHERTKKHQEWLKAQNISPHINEPKDAEDQGNGHSCSLN